MICFLQPLSYNCIIVWSYALQIIQPIKNILLFHISDTFVASFCSREMNDWPLVLDSHLWKGVINIGAVSSQAYHYHL